MRRALLALLFVPTALACTQEEPCPWVIGVDDVGFVTDPLEATKDDWVTLTIQNIDDVEHTVVLTGYEREWTVPPAGEVESEPLDLHTAGDFSFEDAPSGDALAVQVLADDTVGSGGNDTPLPAALTLVALAVAVLRRR